MRAAPPVAFEARSFGAWRAGVAGVALVAVAAIGAWVAGGGPAGAGAALTAVVAGCAVSLWRQRPFSLKWDGACWHLAAEAAEATPGGFDIVMDLGHWMLLRWRAEGHVASRWLPLQAGDAGPHWRAFRAAAFVRPSTPAPGEGRQVSDG